MALLPTRDVLHGLEDLLERERRYVLAGDFDRLHRLVAEKERLVTAATRGRTDLERLALLAERARQNQGLLEAAARGIRSAADLIARKRAAPTGLSTYDRSGRKTDHPAPTATTFRRA